MPKVIAIVSIHCNEKGGFLNGIIRLTGENPGCIMDEQLPQRLGVVCFEASEDELDWWVFLLRILTQGSHLI